MPPTIPPMPLLSTVLLVTTVLTELMEPMVPMVLMALWVTTVPMVYHSTPLPMIPQLEREVISRPLTEVLEASTSPTSPTKFLTLMSVSMAQTHHTSLKSRLSLSLRETCLKIIKAMMTTITLKTMILNNGEITTALLVMIPQWKLFFNSTSHSLTTILD